MDSVTTRVVAFALSALGIVFSGNEAVTRLKKNRSEPERVTMPAPATGQTIVRLVDVSGEPTMQRLPVVRDSVEVIRGLSPDQFWDVVKFRKKSELRIKSPATTEEGSARVSFTERLPAIQAEAQDARPSNRQAVVSYAKNRPRTDLLRSEPLTSKTQPNPTQASKTIVPHSADVQQSAQPRAATVVNGFYRQHGADVVAGRVTRRSDERSKKDVVKAPSSVHSPSVASQAPLVAAKQSITHRLPAPQRELSDGVADQRLETTQALTQRAKVVPTRQVAQTLKPEPPKRSEGSKAESPRGPKAKKPKAIQKPEPEIPLVDRRAMQEAPRVVWKPKVDQSPVSQRPNPEPPRVAQMPDVQPLERRRTPEARPFSPRPVPKAAPIQREVVLAKPVATLDTDSSDVAGPGMQVSQSNRATTEKSVGTGWSPIDLKNVAIGSTTTQSSQRANVREASREDKVAAQYAVQQGFDLAQRRAHYSARAKFIGALRIVARSLDDQSNATDHTRALRNALQAYEEADDFFPRTTRLDRDVNLHVVIGGHNTALLQEVDPNRLTPSHCLREYVAYAEQEFVSALGHDSLASQALYGLGRLEAATETTLSSSPQVRAYRALTLYQAALLVDSENFAAANEVGVLLAQHGKYDEAVSALRHCVRLSPQATAWINLARIHDKLGQVREAKLARAEADRARAHDGELPFVTHRPRVEWVDVDAFVNVEQRPGTAMDYQRPATPANNQPSRQQPPVRTAKQDKRPWFFNFGK